MSFFSASAARWQRRGLFAVVLWGQFLAAQIYRPPQPYTMWDTWLFHEAGTYHLFFVQNEPGKAGSNTIGHAVSRDLIHWQPRPPIETLGAPGEWDHSRTTTGITIKQGGRYVMFYGSGGKGPLHQIGVMFSQDLKTWEKYPSNPVLETKGPYYGGVGPRGIDWRDLYTFFDPKNKVWEGLVCARTSDRKSAIGHVRSRDLIHWDYHPPWFVDESFIEMEVPEYFEMNGRHYLLFSTVRTRRDTSGRKNASGTFYAMADRREGPYRLPPDPLLLGSGQGRFDNYVGRAIQYDQTWLLYSQTALNLSPATPENPTGELGSDLRKTVTWATPKIIEQRVDGTLWLGYWQDLDKLVDRTLWQGPAGEARPETAPGWKLRGQTIEGTAQDGVMLQTLPAAAKDLMITLGLNLGEGNRAGLVWRLDGDHGIALSVSEGRVALEELLTTQNSYETRLIDDWEPSRPLPNRLQVRVLVRDHRSEVYVDNHWIFGASLPSGPMGEGVALAVFRGTAQFTDITIDQVKPLVRP